MPISSSEGRGATGNHAAGVARDTNTSFLRIEGGIANSLAESDTRKGYPEEATPLHGIDAGTENSIRSATSFREETRALNNSLMTLEDVIDKDLLSSEAVTANSLEGPAGNHGTTSFPLASPCFRAHSGAVSWTGDSSSHEEDADKGIYESRSESAVKGLRSKQRNGSGLLDPPRASQQVVVDVQVLQGLQERLLFSEEKLWLTQRQLVDQQGKEDHFKNQILYLEDEVERAQAEGLATASRYIEQAEYLEESQDKLNRLAEENETLEACLSERISEGRALQELAERLILRLGNKTVALLEEGVRVTRALAPAWNRQDLLAELERNQLLHLQLSHVALLYCNNEATEDHDNTKTKPSIPSETGPAPLQSGEFSSQFHPDLLACVGGKPVTECSVSLPGLSDTQTEAPLFNIPTGPPSVESPPVSAVIALGSLPGSVPTIEKSGIALAEELLARKNTSDLSRGHLPGASATVFGKVSAVVSSAAHHSPHRVGTSQPPNVSGASDASQRASFCAYHEEEPAASPPYNFQSSNYILRRSHTRHRGDTVFATTTDQSTLRPSGSFQKFEISKTLSRETKGIYNTYTRDGRFSPKKTQNGIGGADHSVRATSPAVRVTEAYVAVGSEGLLASTGVYAQKDALDDCQICGVGGKPVTSSQASHATAAPNTEGTSEAVHVSHHGASGPNSRIGLRGTLATTRSALLQRARSEARRLSSGSKPTPRSLPKHSSTQENIATGTSETDKKENAVRRRDTDETSTFAFQLTRDNKSSHHNIHQARRQSTSSTADPQRPPAGNEPASNTASFQSISYSRPLKKGTDEQRYVSSSEECNFLVSGAELGEAGIRGAKRRRDRPDDAASNKGVRRSAAATYGANRQEAGRPKSSSNIKHMPSLQAPSRASLDSRCMPYRSCERFAGQQSGLTTEETAAVTDLKRGVALPGAPLVTAAGAGTEKASQSLRAAEKAGGKKGNRSPQTTSRATARRVCPSPRGAPAAALNTRIPSLPPHYASQRLRKEQQQAQLAARDRKGVSSMTQPSPAMSFGDAASKTQLKFVGTGNSPHEVAAAMTKLSAGRSVHSDRNISCTLQRNTAHSCGSPPLHVHGHLTPVDTQFSTTVVTGIYNGSIQKDQQEVCRGGAVQQNHYQLKLSIGECETEHDFQLPLTFSSALTEEPPQVLQPGQTDLKSGASRMISSPSPRLLDSQASHVGEASSEVQESNSSSKSFEWKKMEPAAFLRIGLGGFQSEKEKTDGSADQDKTHTANRRRSLLSLPREDDSESSVATNNGDMIAIRRQAAASRLPPLPPSYQAKLATHDRLPTLTTESHTDSFSSSSSSSPLLVPSQVSRRSVEGSFGLREPCAADVRREAGSKSTSASASLTERNMSRAYCERGTSVRSSSTCPDKTNKDALLEGSAERMNNHVLGGVRSESVPQPRASRYSSESASRRNPDAASLSLESTSTRMRERSQERIRHRSHSTTTKMGALRTAGTDQHRGSKKQEEPRTARTAAQHGGNSSSRPLIQTKAAKPARYDTANVDEFANRASLLLGERQDTVSCHDTAYECSRHIETTIEENPEDTSAFSLTCSSGVSTFRKASSRRSSTPHRGARGSKPPKCTAFPRDSEDRGLQVSSRRRSCATVRHNSASLERKSAMSQQAASSNKKKADETVLDTDTCLYYDGHLERSSLKSLASNGRGHNTRSTISCSSNDINSVHRKDSDINELVYHAVPATGRRLQSPTATTSKVCVDQRKVSRRSTPTGGGSLSDKQKDVHAFGDQELHGSGLPVSHAEDSSCKESSEKNTGNSSRELPQKEERFTDGVGASTLSSSVPIPTVIANEQEQHSVTAVQETGKICPSSTGKGISVLASTNASTFDQTQNRKTKRHSSTRSALWESARPAPAAAKASSPEAPARRSPACLILCSEVSFSCPQAGCPAVRSFIGSADVKDVQDHRKNCQQKQMKGEQQYQQQVTVESALTGPSPRVGSWISFYTAPGAQTTSAARRASLRNSLPLTSGSTCLPACGPSSDAAAAADKVLAEDTLLPKDEVSRQCTNTTERPHTSLQGLSEPPLSIVAGTDKRKLNFRRPCLKTIRDQVHSDAVSAASESLSLNHTMDCPTSGAHRRNTASHMAYAPPPDMRASEGRPQPELKATQAKIDMPRLHTQQHLHEKNVNTPNYTVASSSNAESAAFAHQQPTVTAGFSSTTESDVAAVSSMQRVLLISEGPAESTVATAGQNSPASERVLRSCLRYGTAAPPTVQSPTMSGFGRAHGPWGLHQLPAATATYQPAFCGTRPAAAPAGFTYGAAPPAAFPPCTRSSVPLQQQYKYRTAAQMQEQQQRPPSATADDHRQDKVISSQQQRQSASHYLVEWGARLRPQHWHPLQAQQYQQRQVVAQPLQQKEQQPTQQNLKNLKGSCQQFPCVTQQHQQQKIQVTREIFPPTVARQGQQQQTQLQRGMQRCQEQSAKPLETRSSCEMSPLFIRQTLPLRGTERFLGSSVLPQQQQNQPQTRQRQELFRESMNQLPVDTTNTRRKIRVEASGQLSKWCDSGKAVQLEQQQQQQSGWTGRTCVQQQRRNTTGNPQQGRNGSESGYGYLHSVHGKRPPVNQHIVQQEQSQQRDGIHPHTQQQQPRARSQQQQPQADSQQHGPVQSITEKLNYAQESPSLQLQQPLPPQAKPEQARMQFQQPRVQHLKQPPQQQTSQEVQLPQDQRMRYTCGPVIHEPHLQKQSTQLQHQQPAQQQQQQCHAMSTQPFCGATSGSKQELQEALTSHQQGPPQVPRQWQQHLQQQLLQHRRQQQLQILHQQGRHQQLQLHQLRQQQHQTQSGQVQQQQAQQQVLQQHFWNVVQMHQKGALPACMEKDNISGTLCKASDRPAVINCGPHMVNRKGFVCGSRATISAGFDWDLL